MISVHTRNTVQRICVYWCKSENLEKRSFYSVHNIRNIRYIYVYTHIYCTLMMSTVAPVLCNFNSCWLMWVLTLHSDTLVCHCAELFVSLSGRFIRRSSVTGFLFYTKHPPKCCLSVWQLRPVETFSVKCYDLSDILNSSKTKEPKTTELLLPEHCIEIKGAVMVLFVSLLRRTDDLMTFDLNLCPVCVQRLSSWSPNVVLHSHTCDTFLLPMSRICPFSLSSTQLHSHRYDEKPQVIGECVIAVPAN